MSSVLPSTQLFERQWRWKLKKNCLATHNRRLVRDYEEHEVNREAMILIAASKLMVKRLAKRYY